MPKARFLPLTLAALLGASACSDDTAGGSGSGRGTLSYSNCDEQTALVFVPTLLMPALPDGFAYITPVGQVGVAALHISGAVCQRTGSGEEARDVLAFALAEVPEKYRSPEIATYAVALGGYSNSATSVDQFEAWGLHGLVVPAEVTISLQELAGVRIGSVTAVGADSTLTYSIEALGPETVPEAGGGHTRALYVKDGVVLGAVDAIYSEQTGRVGAGVLTQTGSGPVPLPVTPSVGSHAYDYSLDISSPVFD